MDAALMREAGKRQARQSKSQKAGGINKDRGALRVLTF